MKQVTLLVVVLSLSFGVTRPAMAAQSWCAVNRPNAVFCDDFDRYCAEPPALPEACPSDATGRVAAFKSIWRLTDLGCNPLDMDGAFAVSPPWSGDTPCQEKSNLGITGADLSVPCQNRFGTAYRSVMATDQNPIVLEFVVDGHTNEKLLYANTYIELCAGIMQPLTDYVLSPWCSACGGAVDRYAIVCRQSPSPAGCAPISQAAVLPSIAVGAMAYLDTDSCHCAGSYHSPFNNHLSFFDGRRWWILKQGLFPGGGTGGSPPGDFKFHVRQHFVRLTIKAASVKVEMTSTSPDPDEYSWCQIPLAYTGPFNKIYAGFRAPCVLHPNEWTCNDDIKCIDAAPGGGVVSYDNIAVNGGLGYAPAGACCLPDTTCTSTLGGMQCELLGGQFHGSGTECATTICCPPFQPDHDMDADIDLTDFGWFQTCLSGSFRAPPSPQCQCADLDADGDVDQDDLLKFINCLRGPEIPYNPTCMN